MSITIYGASDDLIEVEGDVTEEFNALAKGLEEGGHAIACSDGTLLRIEYTESGVWRIAPVVKGSGELSIVQAPEDDDENYTDKATLSGDIRWVVQGIAFNKR